MDNPERVTLTAPVILRIALDTPLRRLFDYLPPRDSQTMPKIGARVRVPFGRQRLVGIVDRSRGQLRAAARKTQGRARADRRCAGSRQRVMELR